MFALFALLAIVVGRDYPLGSTARMGPGYFPTVTGALLGLVGLASIVRSFIRAGDAIGRFAIKECILILLAVTLFGLLLKPAGLVLGVATTVLISAIASRQFQLKASILLAIGSAAFCAIVFRVGLGLPTPVLGTWFGG